MTYLLDTNIILFSIVKPKFDAYFEKTYRQSPHDFIISVVTEGELKSLAIQRQWGRKRMEELENSLHQLIIYPIKVQSVIAAYAQIDVYSQGKLPTQPLPAGMTSRNMGKNDLWIAATAHVPKPPCSLPMPISTTLTVSFSP